MLIVATISKNSYSAEKIREILLAGADVLRYNFSHGTPEEMALKVRTAQEVIAELGLADKVKIMADLPGAKMRLGDFPTQQHKVEKGQTITFRSAKNSEDPSAFIPVDFDSIGSMVSHGQLITLGDGEIGFRVTDLIDDQSFKATVLNSWHIPALKAIHVGSAIDTMNHLTPQTLEHIKNLPKINPDWIAFSFVNSASYLNEAKQRLAEAGISDRPIVSKLESPLAMANLDEIAQNSDVLLVARGDLGLYTPFSELGINQKKIILAAKKYGKRSIVSTQMLDSLLSYYVPSRAEVLDVTNAVIDGADGIMLAKETGISQTPGQSVEIAREIINKTKDYLKTL